MRACACVFLRVIVCACVCVSVEQCVVSVERRVGGSEL